jgi:hypothetical protein
MPSSSAAATATLGPGGSGSSMPTSTSVTGRCLSGVFFVVYPPGDNPVRSACLHMGTNVTIMLVAIGGTVWSAPTDSNPAVAAITDQVDSDGTRHDSVQLLRPGTVTLTSASTYTPDPHGPPSRLWSLTLTIVP